MKRSSICLRGLLIAIVSTVSVLAFPQGSCASDLNGTDTRSGCRFELPASWNFTFVRWSGACSAQGVADGYGVLRAYSDGKVAESYFGELRRGHLSMGVIETASGYVAGKFVEGKPLEHQERSDLIAAFDSAAKAAQQMSEVFRRNGNTASFHYYSNKARALREQMD
jgi:hypothetical protein